MAITFAFKKFHYFTYGYRVLVQTDHKPLINIFAKPLENVTARLQRMLLTLLRYDIEIKYLPGKEMLVADILSRSYLKTETSDDITEIEYTVHSLSNNIAMSENKKIEFRKEIENDQVLSKIKYFCETEWPKKSKDLEKDFKFYFALRENIYLSNDLLFLNNKIIVPSKLRKEMLELIHKPHFGIVKSKLRARQIFYWPRLSNDIEDYIAKCEVCQLNRKSNSKETLINHAIPDRPWQYVFSDFFEFKGQNYLLLVDSFSNWIEVCETKTKNSNDVINFCQEKFSQFGIPEIFYVQFY